MKKTLYLLPLFCCLFFSCESRNELARHRALSKAETLIKAGKPEKARYLLDSVISNDSRGIIVDSVFHLRGDLLEITDNSKMIGHALEINQEKDGWLKVERNEYHPSYLFFESSAALAKPILLDIRSKIPAILEQNRKAAKANATYEALAAKKLAAENIKADRVALEQQEGENYIKRTKAQEKLRESFLDQGLDIKVKVSGKRNTKLTLSYPLMNAVLSHRMNKDGNISELLDLGFKEIVLTDGYDYQTTWRPSKPH